MEGLVSGIKDKKSEGTGEMKHLAADIVETAEKKLSRKRNLLGSGEHNVADGIAAGIKSGSNHVEITMNSLFMKVKTPNLNKQTLYSEGRNVAEGLARGIRAGNLCYQCSCKGL